VPNTLTWFTVTSYIYDVEQPLPSGTSEQPELANVSAFVDFFPGTQEKTFPAGFSTRVADLDHGDGTHGDTIVPLAPITGRLLNGSLRSLVIGDPVGVQLLANTTVLGLSEDLFYHTRFRNVTFGGAEQSLANFAWRASVDNTAVNLSSTTLQRFPYNGP
jgi:hypothetical protein